MQICNQNNFYYFIFYHKSNCVSMASKNAKSAEDQHIVSMVNRKQLAESAEDQHIVVITSSRHTAWFVEGQHCVKRKHTQNMVWKKKFA